MKIRNSDVSRIIFMILAIIMTACFLFQSCSSGGEGDGNGDGDGTDGDAGDVTNGDDGSDVDETDTTAPEPGGYGTITVSNITGDCVTLTWTEATDNGSGTAFSRTTAKEDLEYLAYFSMRDDIDGPANIEANGTPVGDWEAGIGSKDVIGLSEDTSYWFNVVVRDEGGNSAAYTMVEADTRDITPPEVSGYSPGEGEEMVLLNTVVTVTFSEPMDEGTLGSGTISLDPSAGGTVSYDAGSFTAAFTPSDDLVPGVTYTASVGTGVEDEAGNGLASGESWSFLTEEYIYRVSVSSEGTEGNNNSQYPAISGDGRYVAFCSTATDLVEGDTNGHYDVFLHDTLTGETVRVSVASDGTEGDGLSAIPTISGDGRYVTFYSSATNLVEGDTNDAADIFVHDTLTGETVRVSVATDGAEGNGDSERSSISGDGRYVAFNSTATDLVEGDTNGHYDVFLHDTLTGETVRVSVASDGTEGDWTSALPSISSDGRFVAFESDASTLVSEDTNDSRDIFLHDTQTDETTRVSVAEDGTQGNDSSFNSSISVDGRYVAFYSSATNLVEGDTNDINDVFLHDTQAGETVRVSVDSDGNEGNGNSFLPSISRDGRYVTYYSVANNLVEGDTNGAEDIFVHDTLTGETVRVSVASDGTESNYISQLPSISRDGRYVAFQSEANNLVTGDTNLVADIFRVLNR